MPGAVVVVDSLVVGAAVAADAVEPGAAADVEGVAVEGDLEPQAPAPRTSAHASTTGPTRCRGRTLMGDMRSLPM